MNAIETIPFSTGCEVITSHPCGLLAINKKAGRTSHPNKTPSKSEKPPMIRAKYNFADESYSWTNKDGSSQTLYLINRLDSPTSGVILASFSKQVAILAKEQFKKKSVEKTYVAIVSGKITQPSGIWTDKISVQKFASFVRSNKAQNGASSRPASLKYSVVKRDENNANLTLLKLLPLTGLTHQLRVQCAMRNHAILGDATYGNFALNKKMKNLFQTSRLFLHCLKTQLQFTLNGEFIKFCAEAPLPESFDKIIRYNESIKQQFLSK